MSFLRGSRLNGLLWLQALAVLGCQPESQKPPTDSIAEPAALARRFDPATCGRVSGRVTWEGDVPSAPPFEVWSLVSQPDGSRQKHLEPNPNLPQVNPRTRGVAYAVVYLRGVDPERSRPWDLDPVRVEQRQQGFHVLQGGVDSRFGFVRRGASVELVSREPLFHSLHASGAEFFTLAFPDPDDPCPRRLSRKGLVELSSAAGYYALRAYLFVDDHPYYARTNSEGSFVLEGVPAGQYDLVCWLAGWLPAREERDPETAITSRLFFRPPAEIVQPVAVAPGATCERHFTLSSASFPR